MIEVPKLILKADDRGHDLAVSNGIDALIENGRVTDVAVMANFTDHPQRDFLLKAIAQSPLRDKPGIGIVLHVNLVSGRPLSRSETVPSLVDSDGVFRCPANPLISLWKEYVQTLSGEDVERELNAQIEKYYRLFGHYPHALDSHHIILAVAPADEIAMKLAQELKIPMTHPKLFADRLNKEAPFSDIQVTHQKLLDEYQKRGILTADWSVPEYWNKYKTLEESVMHLINVLHSLKPGVTELFFHPGHPDYADWVSDPRLERGRVRDYKTLIDTQVCEVVKTLTLTSYRELFEQSQNIIRK